MTSEVGDAIRKLYDTDPDRDTYEGLALQVDDLWERVQQALGSPTPIRHQISTTAEGHDLQAIQIIEHALFGLLNTDAARRRVLNFVIDALDEREKEASR